MFALGYWSFIIYKPHKTSCNSYYETGILRESKVVYILQWLVLSSLSRNGQLGKEGCSFCIMYDVTWFWTLLHWILRFRFRVNWITTASSYNNSICFIANRAIVVIAFISDYYCWQYNTPTCIFGYFQMIVLVFVKLKPICYSQIHTTVWKYHVLLVALVLLWDNLANNYFWVSVSFHIRINVVGVQHAST